MSPPSGALLDRDQSVLLLVDLQERLMPAIAGGAAIVARAKFLADTASRLGVPIVVTEQNPGGLGHSLPQFQPYASEPFAKRHFSAASEVDFLARMPPGRRSVVIAGSEAHVCVLQTGLDLIERGYAVTVVSDAIGSRHEADRLAAIERMAAHGVELVTAEMVAFEWLRTCDDPAFRPILAQIKAL